MRWGGVFQRAWEDSAGNLHLEFRVEILGGMQYPWCTVDWIAGEEVPFERAKACLRRQPVTFIWNVSATESAITWLQSDAMATTTPGPGSHQLGYRGPAGEVTEDGSGQANPPGMPAPQTSAATAPVATPIHPTVAGADPAHPADGATGAVGPADR
jgi:hypothetical protein